MNGFLLVDKEKGFSSNDVVQKIKKKFSFEKVGHLHSAKKVLEAKMQSEVLTC